MFVSLFSQESGLVLHLKRIENKKGSEIEEGQAIIEDCSLQNKVFTGDALHCQKKKDKESAVEALLLCGCQWPRQLKDPVLLILLSPVVQVGQCLDQQYELNKSYPLLLQSGDASPYGVQLVVYQLRTHKNNQSLLSPSPTSLRLGFHVPCNS